MIWGRSRTYTDVKFRDGRSAGERSINWQNKSFVISKTWSGDSLLIKLSVNRRTTLIIGFRTPDSTRSPLAYYLRIAFPRDGSKSLRSSREVNSDFSETLLVIVYRSSSEFALERNIYLKLSLCEKRKIYEIIKYHFSLKKRKSQL